MKSLLIISLMIAAFFKHDISELPTVKSVDLEKYAGTWYEIAKLPNSFEKGLTCITADYTVRPDGKIDVLNKGRLIQNPLKVKSAKGRAWVPDETEPGRLKVRFFWPFGGDYYIIHLDQDYQYVLVGSPSRKYLWILARQNRLDEAIYQKLSNIARENGFNPGLLERTEFDCD